MNWWRSLISSLLPGSPQPAPASRLPADILDLLARRETVQILVWLQRQLQSNPAAQEYPCLIRTARESGWPERDAEKLEILGLFYANRHPEALRRSERYLEEEGFDPDIVIAAANAHFQLSRYEEAYRLLTTVAERNENVLAGRADLALLASQICWAANRTPDMKRYLDIARRLAPDDKVVALCAHNAYFEIGDLAAFEQVRGELGQNAYDQKADGFTRASVELAQDNYEEGFRLAEMRFEIVDAHRYFSKGLQGRSRWQGESLAGKTVLVAAEQGLGDTIQMVRYLPQLAETGAKRLIVESQSETLTLLQFNFPDIAILKQNFGHSPSIAFDTWIGMMSLPYVFKSTAQNIPGYAGYLRVPPDVAAYWHSRVAELSTGNLLRVGLAWSGRPTHRADRRRSIPFALMMDFVRTADADFFALQTHVPPIHPANLIDISDEMVTLADTAALINEMDLVISVDTSVIHVAGAIGKEAWLLLPYRYEWRWSLEGEQNNWYDSVKVLRQKTHGDWNSVLDDAFGERLRAFAGRRMEGRVKGHCPS